MKGDLAKGFQLLKFASGKRVNVALWVLFFVLGLVMEVIISVGEAQQFDFSPFEAGTVFMMCSAMFPSQMLLSVDVSTMIQTSSYKKKLQVSMHSKMLLLFSLLVFTLILVLRAGGLVFVQNRPLAELNILPVGMFAAVIIIYSGFVYKFFVLTVILLYATMMAYGAVCGYLMAAGQKFPEYVWGSASPAVDIIACYLLILAATGLEYVIARGLYKFPLSKYALRCSRTGS